MNKKKIGIIFVVFLVSCVLGLSALYTPKPQGEENTGFSAERAKKDIKEIAKVPHSVTQQNELKKVREYLLGRLTEMGLKPEVFKYKDVMDKYGWSYDVNNIYATIDGKDGENGSYIMLASHYDSSPKKRVGEDADSTGAADDGYGVSTIIEVVRAITESGKSLENGIKILITDAEETGLLGSKHEMENNFELYKNVSFVVNLEARGIKGPAVMFETSDNNEKVIDLFKEAKLPVTYSLAADVYRKLPNGSDFTKFLGKNMSGINIAVLDNLDFYHTKEDNYNNVSDTSLQHYGNQVLPIVEEFVFSDKYSSGDYFKGDENAIFFTFLPNVMFVYSNTTGIALTVVCIALFIVCIVLLSKKYEVSVKKVLSWSGIWMAITLVMAVVGYIISYISSLISGIPFKLTYMPKVKFAPALVIITLISVSILIAIMICKSIKRGAKVENILLGGAALNTILLIVFMVALPGGSFLFLWPVVLVCIALMAIMLLKGVKCRESIILIPVVFLITMYVPVIYMLYIALTIGALAVFMLLTATFMSILIPCGLYYLKM